LVTMRKLVSSVRNIFLVPACLALLFFAVTGIVSFLAERPSSRGIEAFSPNPYCLSDDTDAATLIDAASRDDYRKLSPYFRRRVSGGKVIMDYFGGDLRRMGLFVVSAQKFSAQGTLTGVSWRDSIPKFLSIFRPGSGMQEIFDRAINSSEITEFSGGLRMGSGRVIFLGSPSDFSVKAGAGGRLSSFVLKLELKDRDSDLPVLDALKLCFGEPRAPYLRETSENVSGKLGGMSNAYRNYDCNWEFPDYSAGFKGSYTHNQNYGGSAVGAGINEAFYFEGKLKIGAKEIWPPREK